MGSQQQQQMLDPDAQRQLLAQLGSRGLLKAGPRYDAFGLGSGIPGQDAAAAAAALHNPLTGQQQQQQEQQRLIAELVRPLNPSCLVFWFYCSCTFSKTQCFGCCRLSVHAPVFLPVE